MLDAVYRQRRHWDSHLRLTAPRRPLFLLSDPCLDVRSPVHDPSTKFEAPRPDIHGAVKAEGARRNARSSLNVVCAQEFISCP